MELVIRREDILPALTHAASHAEARGAMPALKCVSMHATADGVLHLGATDFVRTYQGSVRVEVKREGRAAVDAADLLAQVTAFPAKSEITLTVTDHKLALAAKRIRASLAGMDPETMPPLAGIADESVKPVKIGARALADALGHVRPAVAADQTRPHLHAVLMHGRVLVATDGHRMHKSAFPVELSKVLIPAEAVDAWRVALRDAADDAEVTLRASSANAPVTLVTPVGAFSTKTVDAAFPSYEQVLPVEQPWALEINAAEVRAGTRALPTSGGFARFSVESDLAGAALVIEGESDGRSKRAEVGCKVLRGAGEIPAHWGMGLAYLLDALSVAGDGVAILEGHGELDPLTVRVPAVDGYVAVVMPARV